MSIFEEFLGYIDPFPSFPPPYEILEQLKHKTNEGIMITFSIHVFDKQDEPRNLLYTFGGIVSKNLSNFLKNNAFKALEKNYPKYYIEIYEEAKGKTTLLDEIRVLALKLDIKIHKKVIARYPDSGMCGDLPYIYSDKLYKQYGLDELKRIINKYSDIYNNKEEV